MTGCLSILVVAASLLAGAAEAPAAAAGIAAQAKVVANRSSVPDATTATGAALPGGASEDRPVERRGARTSFAGTGGGARGNGGAGSGGWRAWISGLWPLAAVLGLIGVLVVVAKRALPRQWRANLGGRGLVEILGRHPLGGKQSVALLKVGRRVVLVGLTADQLTHLDTITDPDEVAELIGRSASGKGGSLTSAFEREVLREASAYEPSGDIDRMADSDGSPVERAAPYAAARQQLRGLLSRVRSLSGTA